MQYKLAHALNRLSFYYSGIGHRGGTDDMTSDVSREKAIAVVDEAIRIFQEVKFCDVLHEFIYLSNPFQYSFAPHLILVSTKTSHI